MLILSKSSAVSIALLSKCPLCKGRLNTMPLTAYSLGAVVELVFTSKKTSADQSLSSLVTFQFKLRYLNSCWNTDIIVANADIHRETKWNYLQQQEMNSKSCLATEKGKLASSPWNSVCLTCQCERQQHIFTICHKRQSPPQDQTSSSSVSLHRLVMRNPPVAINTPANTQLIYTAVGHISGVFF